MMPAAYQPFFGASMGAAAALLGLLFVAVSISPERTVGAGAPVERQLLAETVFTALVNTFFVSMAGTTPDINLGGVASVLSAFALLQTLRAAWQLWPRQFSVRLVLQRLSLVLVALVIYGLQLGNAAQLIQAPPPSAAVRGEIDLLFALYALALGRSWELLGARRGIFARQSSPTVEDEDAPEAAAPPDRLQRSPPRHWTSPQARARRATEGASRSRRWHTMQ